MKKPPVIICGCHGGGTSYVTKMLRYAGFFAGDDAGDITNRKVHESRAFSKCNEWILQEINPEGSFGMRTVDQEEWKKYYERYQDQALFESIQQRIPTKQILNTYWGGRKKLLLKRLTTLDNVVWGWKDPRNSLTLAFWKEIFPKAKILIIKRLHEADKKGKSVSGSWFKYESTAYVRDIYMNPQALDEEKDDHFFFNFEDVGNKDAFNQLLTWIELPNLNTQQFEDLLIKSKYEK